VCCRHISPMARSARTVIPCSQKNWTWLLSDCLMDSHWQTSGRSSSPTNEPPFDVRAVHKPAGLLVCTVYVVVCISRILSSNECQKCCPLKPHSSKAVMSANVEILFLDTANSCLHMANLHPGPGVEG